MTARATRLAWVACGLTIVLLGVETVLVLWSAPPLRSERDGLHPFPIITVGTALGAVVGALVAARQPRNAVGWLLCIGPLGAALGLAADGFAYAVFHHHLPAPIGLAQLAGYVGILFSLIWALTLLTGAFLLLPDGKLRSRRWRVALWALPVPMVASLVGTPLLIRPELLVDLRPNDLSPAALLLSLVTSTFSTVLLLASCAALIMRLRRARGVQRQQLRWLVTSVLALLVTLLLALAGPGIRLPPDWRWLVNVPLYLAYVSVPVAAGVAILRYRLYDIDVVINRTVVGAAVVGFVTVGYIAVVVTLGSLLGGQVAGRFWPSVIATALVALAFQPMRRAVRRLADRVVYGRRAAPYEALADFSRQLAHAVSIDDVLPRLAEATARSLGAAAGRVSLHVPGAADLVACWPPADLPAEPDHAEPVRQGAEELGEIAVVMTPGTHLRSADRTLIKDLAAQAAVAFTNAQLAAALRARVAEADHQAAQLAESRRRLLAAQESERQRLSEQVRREVVPHLESLPALVSKAAGQAATDPQAAQRVLEAAGVETDRALEALRTIARGVFPPILDRQGLVAALRGYADQAANQVTLVLSGDLPPRLSHRVEAAAFFCAVEAARQLGGPVQIGVELTPTWLVLSVRAQAAGEHGWQSVTRLADRVEACGGSLTVEDGSRTALVVRLPPARSVA